MTENDSIGSNIIVHCKYYKHIYSSNNMEDVVCGYTSNRFHNE